MASGYGYVGSWDIGDTLVFAVQTVDNQGTLSDATSGPDFRIYEDESGTPLVTGTMTLLDSAGTTGLYSASVPLDAIDGFQQSHAYAIYIEYQDGPRLFGELRQFQIGAAADVEFIQTSSVGAAQLRLSCDQIKAGSVDDSTLAPSQTSFESSFNETDPDLYKDRDIYWSTGVLEGSKTSIQSYSFTNGKGRFTVSPMILTPADGDVFFLI